MEWKCVTLGGAQGQRGVCLWLRIVIYYELENVMHLETPWGVVRISLSPSVEFCIKVPLLY